jgi:hypothetical protein
MPNTRQPLQVIISRRNTIDELKRHILRVCSAEENEALAAALPFPDADGGLLVSLL